MTILHDSGHDQWNRSLTVALNAWMSVAHTIVAALTYVTNKV